MSDSTFGVELLPTFTSSVKAWWGSVVPLTLGALMTFAALFLVSLPARNLLEQDRTAAYIALNLLGLVLAGTASVPWYRYALAAADGHEAALAAPFVSDPGRFLQQFVASFWFWAGVLLGIQYFGGIPSLIVILLYAFHGYVIADGKAKGGMMALGTSVRLTSGRRVGLFAVGGLLFIFNLFGFIGLGAETLPTPIRAVLLAIGLSITTSITLVMGAMLYRVFEQDMNE